MSVGVSIARTFHWLVLASDIYEREAVGPAAAVSVCVFQDLVQWGPLQLPVWVHSH